MPVGISAYHCYLPEHRLTAAAYQSVWGVAPGWESKPVAGPDQDALTLAVAVAAAIAPASVDCLALASTSLPYRRRVQTGLLAEALGLNPGPFVSEHTTSTRAGTEALITQWALLAAAGHGTGLTVVADLPVGPVRSEGDALRGAGAVALLLAEGGDVASLDSFAGACTEDPGLQFTPAGADQMWDIQVPDYTAALYSRSVGQAARRLMERLGTRPQDYRFLVLNPPSPRLAGGGARAAGFVDAQWQAAWPFASTGDAGAAQPLLGLAAALDAARPGDRILVLAYGSGSAADAVSLTAGPGSGRGVLQAALAGGRPVDYITYLKLRGEV